MCTKDGHIVDINIFFLHKIVKNYTKKLRTLCQSIISYRVTDL